MTVQIVMRRKKANYLESILKVVTNIKRNNESHEWNSSDGSEKDGSDNDSCNK